MQSIWMDAAQQPPQFPALDRDLEVDTVIVGGGITGLTTALRLVEVGQRVAVLEGNRLGAMNTGRATGNLYATVSEGLHKIRRKWGDEVLRDVVRWRGGAVDWIESVSARHGIDCDFARRPLVRGVAGRDPKQLSKLEEKFAAAEAAGLAPAWVDSVPQLPFGVQRAFRIEGQAQFNPYTFALGLTRLLAGRGVQLFENSFVTSIEASDGRVSTGRGTVKADTIVLATHSPTGFNLVQAEMDPKREHGISALIEGAPSPDGIFWIEDEKMSIRAYHEGGRDYLIVVGGKHRVGHHGEKDYPEQLRDYARSRFGVTEFVHTWGAEQFVAADSLPYIGRSAHDNVLIATGFAADGLTWGAFASGLIDDIIHGRENTAIERLTPRRFTPLKSARIWAKENYHSMKHLAKDWLSDAELDRLDELAPDDGAIVELDGHKRAVYRDAQGQFAIVSPVCTHMGCEVHWNGIERSWDCPCHGSRFATDGAVLDGPAPKPLESFTVGLGTMQAQASGEQRPRPGA